jgi:hypothetical protein
MSRVSIESGAVKKVLGHHSIQVDARDKSDLDEKDIVIRLRKAGGADYNGEALAYVNLPALFLLFRLCSDNHMPLLIHWQEGGDECT